MDGYCRYGLFVARSAKLIVINRCKDRWILTANWTLRIAPQIELSKFDLECVEVKQPSNQGLANTDNELDRLNGLQHSDYPGQHSEHARLRAVRYRIRRRGFRKKAPVAGSAQVRREHGRLPFEPKYRAVHIWLLLENTDVVGQITRGEII